MQYGDITVGTLDQHYLDELSDKYDVDYYDAKVHINENMNSADITNQLFDYVLTEAVQQLDISDDSKEYLQSKIHCNCLDSWFDINSEDVDDMIDWTKEEKEIIKDFLDL